MNSLSLCLEFLRTLVWGRNRIRRFLHACNIIFQSPAKTHISLEHIKLPDRDIKMYVQNYMHNIMTAKYHANLLGSKYLTFLQPFNGYGKDQMSRFDNLAIAHVRNNVNSIGENQLDLIIRFYDELWKSVKELDFFYDLREIFKNYDEIYFDHAHLSDLGQDILAKKIAECIITIEQKTQLMQ